MGFLVGKINADLDIIGLFLKDISISYSINQIAQELKKPYPFMHQKITALLESGVLKKTIIARSHLCSLDFSNDQTIALIMLASFHKKEQHLKNIGKETFKEICSLKDDENNRCIFLAGQNIYVLQNHLKFNTQNIKNLKIEHINSDLFQELVLSDKKFIEKTVILHSYEKYFQEIEKIIQTKNERQISGGKIR